MSYRRSLVECLCNLKSSVHPISKSVEQHLHRLDICNFELACRQQPARLGEVHDIAISGVDDSELVRDESVVGCSFGRGAFLPRLVGHFGGGDKEGQCLMNASALYMYKGRPEQELGRAC